MEAPEKEKTLGERGWEMTLSWLARSSSLSKETRTPGANFRLWASLANGATSRKEKKRKRKEKKGKGKIKGVGEDRDLANVNAKRSWAHQCSSREASIGWRPKVRQWSAASYR